MAFCLVLSLISLPCYAQEGDLEVLEEMKAKLLSMPTGYYERGVVLREAIEEEIVVHPVDTWLIKTSLGANTSEIYDDNVFNDDDNTRNDYISTVSPWLRMSALRGRLFLNSIFNLRERYYHDLSVDTNSYSAGGGFTYKISKRMRANFLDTYSKESSLKEVPGTDIRDTGGTTNTIDSNTLKASLTYDLKKNSSVTCNYTKIDKGVSYHGRNDDIDSVTDTIAVDLKSLFGRPLKPFGRRASVSVGYSFDKSEEKSSTPETIKTHMINLGVLYPFNKKFKIDGDFGIGVKKSNVSGEKKGALGGGLLFETKPFSDRNSLIASYAFDTVPSYERQADYETHVFGVNFGHEFTPIISGSVVTSYKFDSYEEGTETETIDINPALDIMVHEQVKVTLSYRFTDKNTTDTSGDARSNIFMVAVKMLLW